MQSRLEELSNLAYAVQQGASTDETALFRQKLRLLQGLPIQ